MKALKDGDPVKGIGITLIFLGASASIFLCGGCL